MRYREAQIPGSPSVLVVGQPLGTPASNDRLSHSETRKGTWTERRTTITRNVRDGQRSNGEVQVVVYARVQVIQEKELLVCHLESVRPFKHRRRGPQGRGTANLDHFRKIYYLTRQFIDRATLGVKTQLKGVLPEPPTWDGLLCPWWIVMDHACRHSTAFKQRTTTWIKTIRRAIENYNSYVPGILSSSCVSNNTL
jgi:hypothetical protein